MLAERYYEAISDLLARIQREEMQGIRQAADLALESILKGGLLHMFGSGHSHMMCEEAFRRAGGLCCINAIMDPALSGHGHLSTKLERLEGYVPTLLSHYDLRAGETIIIISHSGINAAPVEAASYAKDKGLNIVAVTSLKHSQAVASRVHSGRKLFELADVVLNTGGPIGDAILEAEQVPVAFCSTSTITGTFIINCLIATIIEGLLTRGQTPSIRVSANVPHDYQALCQEYDERIALQGH